MTFHSVLGPHSDRDRRRLRAIASAATCDWTHRPLGRSRMKNHATLLCRRVSLGEIVHKYRAGLTIHVQHDDPEVRAA